MQPEAAAAQATGKDWTTIVLALDVSFAALDGALRVLDWRLDADPTAPIPWVPGEPELARWSRVDDDDRAISSYDPATGVRSVAVRGANAARRTADVATMLPTLDVDAVAALLAGGDTMTQLRGIHAARALRDARLVPLLAPLAAGGDEAVVREATATLRALVGDEVERGARWLARERKRRPGRSILFAHAGGPRERRQILRWLMHDEREAGEPVLEVLRAGLEDRDWEVRATAMIAAARLHAAPVRSLVNRVALPTGGAEGLDDGDRNILRATRVAAVAALDGRPPLDEEAAHHVMACVLGAPVTRHDRVFLLLHSLATPLPDEFQSPTALPPGVIEDGDEWLLESHALPLVWVPPLEHWLGDGRATNGSVPAPIRASTSRGFLIARRPLAGRQNHSAAAAPHADAATAEVTWDEEIEVCARLGDESGAALRIAEPDEWEMAARGPDGRRYPWGVGLERSSLGAPSPWGIEDAVGGVGQWTAARHDPSCAFVSGRGQFACSVRMLAKHGQRCTVRPVIEL